MIKKVFEEIPLGVTETFPLPVIDTPVLVDDPADEEMIYAVGVPKAGTGVTEIGGVPINVGDWADVLGVVIV